ncbi:MAG: alpha-L-fucosidase [Verrucomicrobiota bacterium]
MIGLFNDDGDGTNDQAGESGCGEDVRQDRGNPGALCQGVAVPVRTSDMRNQMITRIGVGLLTASVAMAVVCDAFCETRTPPAKLARPSAEQAAWQDLELGLFIHYDMPVFKPGWDHRQYEKRPEAGLFNPAKLDTDQWMEAAKGMGAKYAVFVAKHGSGFMCWQSDLYPYGMKQSPYKEGKGDIVGDFVNSCRRSGIQPGIYAHMGCNGYLEVDNPGLVNRGKGGDPEKQARYAKICEGMLTELWGNYGKLGEIWFDGGVLDPAKGGPNMLPILHKFQPGAIVFQGPAATIRWIGNEDGVAPYPCWATVPEVRDYNGPGSPDGPRWLPGECDVPIRKGIWMWEPNTESRLLSVNELMELYYQSVGHNCNLLLNVNPDPDGLVPAPDLKRYREFGDEIRRRFSRSVAETSGRGEVLELALPKEASINHVIIQEQITEGERVREYVVEALVEGQWKELCKGTAIGHKRIQRFNNQEAGRVRVRITASVAEPILRRVAVYNVPPVPASR